MVWLSGAVRFGAVCRVEPAGPWSDIWKVISPDPSPAERGVFAPVRAVVRRHAGSLTPLTRTSFLLTNSWMPRADSSRPKPERFVPPKGRSGAVHVG